MKYLKEIWFGKGVEEQGERLINGLAFNSQLVKPGYIFFAIQGLRTDGHLYIPDAIKHGAEVVFCEKLPEQKLDRVTYIQVTDTAIAMAAVADKFFDKPSSRLRLVGVTGTNGKTTVVTLLYQLFRKLGYKVGQLSTVETKINDRLYPSRYTTPDSLSINKVLNEMVEDGCDYAFMEVSSHAVKQERVHALHFAGGVFTNLSHDHLDYHGTFDEYLRQKKRFFDQLSSSAFALTNIDDRRGEIMVQNTKAKVRRYSLQQMADYRGKILSNNLLGLQIRFNQEEFFSQLMGKFNAYNLLAVYGASILLDAGPALAKEMSALIPAAGRMDRVNMPSKEAIAFVDYAHTPDALKNILATIQDMKPPESKVICVVGCGGNRDKSKRPKMANIACQMSDWVIFTSDNPRDEDPDQIIQEMEEGIPEGMKNKVVSITDRRQAIKTGFNLLQKHGVLVVAGKGHEPYQEIRGVRHPFDDKKILLELSNEDI